MRSARAPSAPRSTRANPRAILDNQPSLRVEFFSGLGWIALGSAIVYGSWTMDRLENLNINPYTAPGLVPGVLGAVIALCAAGIMAVPAPPPVSLVATAPPLRAHRFSICAWRFRSRFAWVSLWGWSVAGRHSGPLRPSSFFSMSSCSSSASACAQRSLWRGILVALGVSAGASFAITMVFQEFFLVRLP